MKLVGSTLQMFILMSSFHVISGQESTDSLKKYGYDSLRKYSYLISGIINDHAANIGTGFFIKSDKNVYLISAAHVLTGWNALKEKWDKNYPDRLLVKLTDRTTGDDILCSINVKTYKKKLEPFSIWSKPDIFIYKVKDPSSYIINSIENLLVDTIATYLNEINRVFGYGFASYSHFSDLHSLLHLTPTLIDASTVMRYDKTPNIREDNLPDSMHFMIAPTFPSKNNFGRGASGAPIFIYSEKLDRFIFGGVVVAANNKGMFDIVVRFERFWDFFKANKDRVNRN
jgi:hypothetical protein